MKQVKDNHIAGWLIVYVCVCQQIITLLHDVAQQFCCPSRLLIWLLSYGKDHWSVSQLTKWSVNHWSMSNVAKFVNLLKIISERWKVKEWKILGLDCANKHVDMVKCALLSTTSAYGQKNVKCYTPNIAFRCIFSCPLGGHYEGFHCIMITSMYKNVPTCWMTSSICPAPSLFSSCGTSLS